MKKIIYNDITFNSQNKYSNAGVFKEYSSGKFTAFDWINPFVIKSRAVSVKVTI